MQVIMRACSYTTDIVYFIFKTNVLPCFRSALIKGGRTPAPSIPEYIISSRSFYGSKVGHCAPSPNRKKNGMTYGKTR